MKQLRSYSDLCNLIKKHGYSDLIYSMIETTRQQEFRTDYASMMIRIALKNLIAELEKQHDVTAINHF